MSKVEIIPPKKAVATYARVPTVHVGGVLAGTFQRMSWESKARTVAALAKLNENEAACVQAMTLLTENQIKLNDARFRLQDSYEEKCNELEINRERRAKALLMAAHDHEMARIQCRHEVTVADANLTLARVAYVDARQQLAAQEEHGGLKYKLEQKMTAAKVLDVELGIEERRRMLRGVLEPEGDNTVALLEQHRQSLLADGLDTSAVDEELARLRK